MNTIILRKCLAELQSATPRLEYVEGMLETLIEMNEPTKPARETIEEAAKNLPNTIGVLRVEDDNNNSEAAILEARARAAVESIKAMSEASAHE